MHKFNISETSRLTGKSRTTIHRYIATGKLSAVQSEQGIKTIDLAELLRVFPDIKVHHTVQSEQIQSVQIEQCETQKNNENEQSVQLLKQQITYLEDLLKAKDDHISTLKKSINLLEYKKDKNWKFWK